MPDSVVVQMEKLLEEYSKEVDDACIKAVTQTARNTASLLRSTSPKKTGTYAKGWTVKREDEKTAIVHNRTRYMLTHVLNNGYAKRNQYGTYGRVGGDGHIANAEQWGIQEFESAIERGLP